jgi:hypothetical protein
MFRKSIQGRSIVLILADRVSAVEAEFPLAAAERNEDVPSARDADRLVLHDPGRGVRGGDTAA